jgi:chromate transporter
VQSFGGGVATLALIRRTSVEQKQWVTAEEFARYWSLVQLVPGVNLLAITILLGRKVGGWRGVIQALTGILFPSVTITILLTLAYRSVQAVPKVQAALGGVIPAVVGLGLINAFQIARPLLRKSENKATLALGLSIVGASAAALGHLPVVAVLLGSGILFGCWRSR